MTKRYLRTDCYYGHVTVHTEGGGCIFLRDALEHDIIKVFALFEIFFAIYQKQIPNSDFSAPNTVRVKPIPVFVGVTVMYLVVAF